MAGKTRAKQQEDQKEPVEVTPVIEGEVLPAKRQPVPPQDLTNEEAEALKSMARELAAELQAASGSRELEAMDGISNLGLQSQRGAASELTLLRARVGDMMTREGPSQMVATDMAELRLTLNQINPQENDQKGVLAKVLSGGILGRGAGSVRSILEKIAIRYEPVSEQITVIESRLREGRAMLAKDNIELRKLYESVESQRLPVQRNAYLGELLMQELDALYEQAEDSLKRNAYLGELLMQELDALYEQAEDSLKRERLRNTLHDVALRVQDLRTMDEVDVQFFVSIDLTRQNNARLGQAVERTLALSTNVVMVGLAIQMALARQKRVMEANLRTREFLANLIVSNAAVIKQHTTDIGDAYNNPVIAVEKLSQVHNDLIEAMDATDRIKQEGIARARENIAKLAEMSANLERRSQGLEAAEARSVEA